MNKGNLKGTNTSGSNPVNNETNVITGQDSTVFYTQNKFFPTGIAPTNENYKNSSKNILNKSTRTYNNIFWTLQNSQFGSPRSMAFGNGLWVAGVGRAIQTSTDTITWVTQNSQFGTTGIISVAYGNGLWVAGGQGGTLRTSTDAVTWVTQTSQFVTTIQSVAYGNGLWVAGGLGGTLRTSTDAVTWVTQTSNFGTSIIYSVAYGNSLWVAGGVGGTLRTSTDAVTWVTQNSNSGTNAIYVVAYGNGLWIAAGQSYAKSTDGVNWVTASMPSTLSPSFDRVVSYQNNLWVWCPNTVTTTLYFSTDATTWVVQKQALSTDFTTIASGVAYGNGIWAVAFRQTLYSSINSPVAYPVQISGVDMWFLP